jgi:acid phosphatase
MHDGSVQQGDTWLKNNLSALADWCMANNSIFMVYFDESETEADNRIPVLAVGGPVKQGYQSARTYDHYSWSKTILRMFNAPYEWTANLQRAKTVTDAWQ